MNKHPANLYINFVLNAVLGHLPEADAMLREFRPAIRHVARILAVQHPYPRLPLHRGIVLDGPFDPGPREFVSWSEDPDVAEWFADPRSFVNEYVSASQKGSIGYLLTSSTDELVLWHHSWARLENWPLFAKMHPHMGLEGARQLDWSMKTQSEVITEPPAVWPERRPFVSARAPLDERYAPPWML